MQSKITLAYIHLPGDAAHEKMAENFVGSYLKYQPEFEHNTIIISQGAPPTEKMGHLFSSLQDCTYFLHDDSGWDIGGFLSLAKHLKNASEDDVILCCGGSAFFRRAGWMRIMMRNWEMFGPGVYGSNSTYEVSPHLNTSGFWCSPKLMARYPIEVKTKQQRYDFEHGPNALWKWAHNQNIPTKLVTWCGAYDWQEWRKPPNIFRRGNQSNCLTYWHHHTRYETAVKSREIMRRHTDTLTDPLWMALKRGKPLSKRERETLSKLSYQSFVRAHKHFP